MGSIRLSFECLVQNRTFLVLVLMASYSTQCLLITASKQRGEFAYDLTVVVLLAELAKLVFVLAMLPPEGRRALSLRTSWPYVVPAALYTLQNRLVFEALRHLSPPEYQLLNNMKLFTTSIAFRVLMRRQLRLLQWMALALLSIGMVLATAAQHQEGGFLAVAFRQPHEAASRAGPGMSLYQGTLVMCVVAWCSAFAGVLNEWLIKKSAGVLQANVWLYTYGVVGCAMQLSSQGSESLQRAVQLHGFTAVTWLVVLCNAVLGQSIAYIFRYADSIVKLYAVCAAMVATTLASVVFFGYQLNLQAVCGYMVFGLSMCLYYMPPDVLLAPDSELVARSCRRAAPSLHGTHGTSNGSRLEQPPESAARPEAAACGDETKAKAE